MTQPAKVQDPPMEEILASIRRIIADDEAKPAEKTAAPAPPARRESSGAASATRKAPAISDFQHEAPTRASASEAPPAATNSQEDIDAMLAGLDAATSE